MHALRYSCSPSSRTLKLENPFELRVAAVLLMWPGARFSKGPETFQVRRQILKSKKFLAAHKPVNFASLTDSFIISFSKLLEPCSWMRTWQTRSSYEGPKSYREFWETRSVSLSIHGHTPCFTLKLCTRIALNFSCVLQSSQAKEKTIGAVKKAGGAYWASSGNAARTPLGLILHDLQNLDFLDTRFVRAKAIYSILIFS